MKSKGISTALAISLLLPIHAAADTDPFPAVKYGETIPGYEVWDYSSRTWEQFAETDAYKNLVCPFGSQKGGIHGYRWDIGRYNYANCWKNIKSAEELAAQAAQEAYQREINEAQKAAEEESRRWNEANPGKQKCVQWGPITGPGGSQASGGVCANPVPAGTAPTGSVSVDAPSVGERDISEGASSSPTPEPSSASPTLPASGETSSSSKSTTSSPITSGSSPDPTPSGGASYRGNGFPFTYIVEGQVSAADCPAGFQAANGLIVDVSARKTYTECWPLRAWTANRLGGEAWELFKATGGTYDPTVEVERREKVALLKSKAKEVAEAAAKQTPGIERCSSWSGFGESGRECAYAFISPSSTNSPPVGVGSSSSSVSDSQAVTVIAGSSSQQVTQEAPSSSETSGAAESNVSTRSVAVGLDAVSISGTSVQIARTALTVTTDPVEAQSISSLAENVAAVPTVIKSQTQTLPRMANLDYRVTSLTPEICRASTWRVRMPKPGLCQLEFEIVDSDGNTYEFVKKMRRKG